MKLQSNLYSQEILEHFGENGFIFSCMVAVVWRTENVQFSVYYK